MKRTHRPGPPVRVPSGFAGFRFPPENLAGGALVPAVRLVLPGPRRASRRTWRRGRPRHPLSVGAAVHTLVDRGCPSVSASGRGSLVRRGDVRQGRWGLRYVYRAVDQHGQVIDVFVSHRQDIGAARTFFTAALSVHGDPGEVVTDREPALANMVEELLPAVWHNTGQYENNRVECDHGRLEARLRPMRG